MDYFENVEIDPIDTEIRDVINLNVKVKEKQTGSISIGGGYSSEDGLFTTGQIQQKNLFGTGDVVSLKAYLGQLASRYIISYTHPYAFGTPLTVGIDLYNWERAYQDFTENSYGVKLRAGYPSASTACLTGYYIWQDAEIDNLDALAQRDPIFPQGLTRFSGKKRVRARFERNTTDHPFLPTKGTYIGAILEYSSKALGGDYNLFKQEYHVGVYYPLFWKFIGHLRGEVGFENPGGLDNFPIYERYFPRRYKFTSRLAVRRGWTN